MRLIAQFAHNLDITQKVFDKFPMKTMTPPSSLIPWNMAESDSPCLSQAITSVPGTSHGLSNSEWQF